MARRRRPRGPGSPLYRKGLDNLRVLGLVPQYSQALALRQQGLSYPEMAEQMAVSTDTAKRYVQQALNLALRGPAEDVRQLELSRLDTLLAVWWPRAVNGVPVFHPETGEVFLRQNPLTGHEEPVLQPSDKALDAVLKIVDRRYKLLGFDRQTAQANDSPREVVLGILRQIVTEEDAAGRQRETQLTVASWRPASVSGEQTVVDGQPPRLPDPPSPVDGWDDQAERAET